MTSADQVALPGAADMDGRDATRLPGPWFPLLLPGALIALSLPLAVLTAPRISGGIFLYAPEPTVTRVMYLGGSFPATPSGFPLGWYWVGTLAACWLLTAAWCRRRGHRTGQPAPLRGYLVTGLVLAVVTAALPLLAWGIPVTSPGTPALAWLDAFWEQGTFALLAIAVSLGMLARTGRSRALAAVTAIYAAAVCLAGWAALSQAIAWEVPYPPADLAVLLPAAVLLLAGVGTLAAAGLQPRSGRLSGPAATG